MRSKSRLFALFIAVFMAFAVFPASTYAAAFTDIEGHWAQQTIQTLANDGIVNGKGDGTFQPDSNITRAEYFTLVNRVFGFTEESSIGFKDVRDSDWFAVQIKRAVAAGYLTGYEDNTVRPNANITRAEVATVLSRLLGLSAATGAADKFTDAGSIPSWAKTYVDAVTGAGLISGYPDGSFKPGNNLTRAEAAALFARVRTYYSAQPASQKPVTEKDDPDATAKPPVRFSGSGGGGGGGGSSNSGGSGNGNEPSSSTSVTGITVNITSLNLSIGETRTLTATVLPTNASNKNVVWSSNNESVAVVNQQGTVTAKTAGTARITVTTADGGKTAVCDVAVTSPVTPPAEKAYSYRIDDNAPAGVGETVIYVKLKGVDTDAEAVWYTVTYSGVALRWSTYTNEFKANVLLEASYDDYDQYIRIIQDPKPAIDAANSRVDDDAPAGVGETTIYVKLSGVTNATAAKYAVTYDGTTVLRWSEITQTYKGNIPRESGLDLNGYLSRVNIGLQATK